MRVLVVGLEYGPVFSGNGVLTRNIVKALTLEHEVLVVCAVPSDVDAESATEDKVKENPHFTIISLPVTRWGRLDRDGPWLQFAEQAMKIPQDQSTAISMFKPHVILSIDWSALAATAAIQYTVLSKHVPTCFYNFRVFSDSPELHKTTQDRLFYAYAESVCSLCIHTSADTNSNTITVPCTTLPCVGPLLSLCTASRCWLGTPCAPSTMVHIV
eukprot:m.56927 g.56927  ORF g.56927 m.56927 type:complete len:214 (-) comp11579_c0_seq1:56-697(-)